MENTESRDCINTWKCTGAWFEARCYDTMSPVNQARVEISCKDVGAPYNVGEIDWVKILRPTRLKIGHFGDVVEQIAAATEHVFKITRKSVRRQQGVSLTGRNRTGPSGPPCSVGRRTAHAPGGRPARTPAELQTTDDADRRQRAKQYWPIRRASNNYGVCLWPQRQRRRGNSGLVDAAIGHRTRHSQTDVMCISCTVREPRLALVPRVTSSSSSSSNTIRYDTVDLCALKSWRDGQLNLAHGPAQVS